MEILIGDDCSRHNTFNIALPTPIAILKSKLTGYSAADIGARSN
jgi:hypothetical protein